MIKFFPHKWRLSIKVLPIMAGVLLAKLLVHYYNLEFLPLSALFTAVISANIFLIGFLISGVLSDYKESEKIPSDLATSLETLSDEAIIIYKNKKDKVALEYLNYLKSLTEMTLKWFKEEERTNKLMQKISGLNDYFLKFESLTQANFIARLKGEQTAARRIINRVHTIRETSFNQAGYAIVEIITMILSVGMIFLKIDPYYVSIFFVSFVSFMLVYLLLLIKDLDDPFGHDDIALSEEVSLKPVEDVLGRLNDITSISNSSGKN
jgi:predicted membrane chloride channel (bestrophin family)